MNISKSDIVVSLAGRDQGKLFYVLSTEKDYALLADGKTRRLEKPKRKKLKHIRFIARSDSKVAKKLYAGDAVSNSELRRDLAIFGQEADSQNQGG